MTTAPAQPVSSRRGLLVRHPLVSFFVMAYAFSWIVWSPWVLGEDGAGLLPIQISQTASRYLNAAAILAGPTLAAFIMTATTEGRAGVRRLLRYTDSEEVLFDATRPQLFNGITEVATRPDLLDRALVVMLPPIPEERRRPEAELWLEFENARPRILA